MPRRMVNPKINEVSGVDHPAHLEEGWLTMKDGSPETRLLLARAEAIAKGIDPDTVTEQGMTMPDPITKEVRDALPEDVQEYVKSLEAIAVLKAAEPVAPATAEPTEAEVFEKAISTLPEAARTVLLKQQRQAAADRAVAKQLVDEREDAKFTAIAKSLRHVPGVTEASAVDFRKAAEADPGAWAVVLKSLEAANTAIAEGKVFGEIGSSQVSFDSNAAETLDGLAKALQAADPELSAAEAMEKAANDNPTLYAQHRAETSRGQRVEA